MRLKLRGANMGRKLTRQDLREAAEKYKNWGRWGPQDEIGTLNYTRAEDIVAAARLVRKGKVISLALNFDNAGSHGACPEGGGAARRLRHRAHRPDGSEARGRELGWLPGRRRARFWF